MKSNSALTRKDKCNSFISTSCLTYCWTPSFFPWSHPIQWSPLYKCRRLTPWTTLQTTYRVTNLRTEVQPCQDKTCPFTEHHKRPEDIADSFCTSTFSVGNAPTMRNTDQTKSLLMRHPFVSMRALATIAHELTIMLSECLSLFTLLLLISIRNYIVIRILLDIPSRTDSCMSCIDRKARRSVDAFNNNFASKNLCSHELIIAFILYIVRKTHTVAL